MAKWPQSRDSDTWLLEGYLSGKVNAVNEEMQLELEYALVYLDQARSDCVKKARMLGVHCHDLWYDRHMVRGDAVFATRPALHGSVVRAMGTGHLADPLLCQRRRLRVSAGGAWVRPLRATITRDRVGARAGESCVT